jgi:preprotein translocase subunit SecE
MLDSLEQKMADDDDNMERTSAAPDIEGTDEGLPAPAAPETAPEEGVQSLGAAKYVHGSFFVIGVSAAYLASKLLAAAWDELAAWAPAARAVPQLLVYGEDERPAFTLVVGAVIGVLVVLKMFRGPSVRAWADDVAAELSKVVWPTRDIVTNGTIVVIVATALATVYIGLLDRLWGFVTTLVYGA